MAVETRWVPYGRPAAAALRDAVAAAKAGDPLAPVTVVVPSNYVGVAVRRQLASGALGPVAGPGPGLAGATFLTVYRLAELLGAHRLAATGRRPVSTPVVAAAVRAELAARPGRFAPVAEHPATEEALVATLRELDDVPPEGLSALQGSSARARELVDLHRRVRGRLAPAWYTEADLLGAAADAAGAAAVELGHVVVFLPQRLGRSQAALLAAVGQAVPLVVLAGHSGDPRADAAVREGLAPLGAPEPPAAAATRWPDRLEVQSASDADDEVRAARRLVTQAMEAGTPLERIAVLYAAPEPYATLVHDHLMAAGIPFNGTEPRPAAARLAGRALLSLLRLRQRGARRSEVMALVADARLRGADGRPAPAARWDRLAREAFVVGGRDQWDGRLLALAADLDSRAAAVRDEGDDARAERLEGDAAEVRALRSYVLDLVDALDPAALPRSWSGLAAWARRQLDHRIGDADVRAAWPPTERVAADKVEAALARLGTLDGVGPPPELDVFTRTLELELDADLGRAGRFGEGVLVGGIGTGIGLDLDLVVVLGMAEGTFPSHPRDDALVPDRERAVVHPHLALRRDAVHDQHRQLLATVAGADRAVLCWPRGDLRRNAERTPSRWLLDAVGHLEHRVERPGADELDAMGARPWRHDAPSFAGEVVRAHPATAQELRLRHLATSGRLHDHPVVQGDPVLASGVALLAARRSSAFTRFDGNLAGLDLAAIMARPVSPTRLEQWVKCPFAFLVKHVLGIGERDDPDDELQLTALDRGSLVHVILEEFVAGALEGEGAGPGWTGVDADRLDAVAERWFGHQQATGRAGRELFWRRDRAALHAELRGLLAADDQRLRAEGLRPIAAELAFGRHGLAVVERRLPDGRTVRFTGSADRVDQDAHGRLVVTDYKTGKPDKYHGLSAENPVLGGTRLQLPVYALAARAVHGRPDTPVHAQYWFTGTPKGPVPIGYEVDDDVLAHFDEVLGTIVSGITAGVFPQRPEPSLRPRWVACAFCDPDGLGVADIERHWERKRDDPAAARYVQLVEAPPPTSPAASPTQGGDAHG